MSRIWKTPEGSSLLSTGPRLAEVPQARQIAHLKRDEFRRSKTVELTRLKPTETTSPALLAMQALRDRGKLCAIPRRLLTPELGPHTG